MNEEIKKVKEKIEDSSSEIDEIVNNIITPYIKPLDDYVSFVASILKDGNNAPTAEELDDFIINLSTQIYFASGLSEQLGIRDDIAKAVYKETYHNKRNSLDSGTVSDKDSIAELASQKEQLISVAYSRSFKIVKNKVEAAQEMVSSIKKVISRRTVESELTRMVGK